MSKPEGGEPDPAIAAALFCENVLVERDGTHSFIRVVDSVAMFADASVDLTKEHTLTHPLALAVVLRSREVTGTARITIRHTPPPGGTRLEGLPTGAEIELSRGHLTVASVRLTGGQVGAGLHEFEIRMSGGARTVASMRVDVSTPIEAAKEPQRALD